MGEIHNALTDPSKTICVARSPALLSLDTDALMDAPTRPLKAADLPGGEVNCVVLPKCTVEPSGGR